MDIDGCLKGSSSSPAQSIQLFSRASDSYLGTDIDNHHHALSGPTSIISKTPLESRQPNICEGHHQTTQQNVQQDGKLQSLESSVDPDTFDIQRIFVPKVHLHVPIIKRSAASLPSSPNNSPKLERKQLNRIFSANNLMQLATMGVVQDSVQIKDNKQSVAEVSTSLKVPENNSSIEPSIKQVTKSDTRTTDEADGYISSRLRNYMRKRSSVDHREINAMLPSSS